MGYTFVEYPTVHCSFDIFSTRSQSQFLFVHMHTHTGYVTNAQKEGDLFGIVASNTWQQQEACRDMKSVKMQLHSNMPQVIFTLK